MSWTKFEEMCERDEIMVEIVARREMMVEVDGILTFNFVIVRKFGVVI